MSIVASAKAEILKTTLAKIVDGNSGSTLLGVMATGILASGVQFSDLFGSDQTKQAHAIGLIVGSVILASWGWRIGRKPSMPTA